MHGKPKNLNCCYRILLKNTDKGEPYLLNAVNFKVFLTRCDKKKSMTEVDFFI